MAAQRAKGAGDGDRNGGVKRKSPSGPDSSERRRPVARQSDRGDEGWLSRAGDALGAKLFSLAGLDDCAPARYGNGWYSRSERPCPFPGCGNVHTNNYCISVNTFGSVILTSFNKGAHYPESMVVELDAEAVRAMQDTWAVANAGATDLVRGYGCFYKTAVASGGERVTWRVFMPWEERDGGRCMNAVPAELWATPGVSTTMDMKGILAEVERAYLSVSTFIGEFGPSETGKTLCGVEFTSKDPCHICGEVHGGAQPYRVALVKSGERILIYAPCINGADGWRYPVFKEAERARGRTNAELMSTWAVDEAVYTAASEDGAVASQITFKDALLRIVASETWADQLEAATDAYDVANGKKAGTSAHYRALMSQPTRDGRPGQPRAVVRIEYTRQRVDECTQLLIFRNCTVADVWRDRKLIESALTDVHMVFLFENDVKGTQTPQPFLARSVGMRSDKSIFLCVSTADLKAARDEGAPAEQPLMVEVLASKKRCYDQTMALAALGIGLETARALVDACNKLAR